ncbi:MAG: DUF5615 family PIN-like protein [Candidatus Eremiobacteraeota bacterium]|nr:DUF5615 family PIN-like protein [Candidatus Eremiobacteraeota bacterium]
MKFKLDENFGTRVKNIFQSEGYDVQTVHDQGIAGCSDRDLFRKCCAESRCLVTMDLDFADVTRFPPNQSSGIAVFRQPKNSGISFIEQLVRQYLKALTNIRSDEKLCIIEAGRIRVHEAWDADFP